MRTKTGRSPSSSGEPELLRDLQAAITDQLADLSLNLAEEPVVEAQAKAS